MISARVIADSVNPNGVRLTTYEATFNRYILAEVNTYREWSRNSASSRAIPVQKVMRQVWSDPATPIHWGANQKGMQAKAELTGWRRWWARRVFLWARLPVLALVWVLTKLKLHKQVTNRLLEPWIWHTAIVSSTNIENMLGQRDNPDAQPEFQVLSRCFRKARDESVPRRIGWGGWHLPYVENLTMSGEILGSEDPFLEMPKVSAACCAAVSYLRQNDRKTRDEYVALAMRLISSRHWSPFEHVAQAIEGHVKDSNFDAGWKQLRKFFPKEDGRG
jgi:hypothetical protein